MIELKVTLTAHPFLAQIDFFREMLDVLVDSMKIQTLNFASYVIVHISFSCC